MRAISEPPGSASTRWKSSSIVLGPYVSESTLSSKSNQFLWTEKNHLMKVISQINGPIDMVYDDIATTVWIWQTSKYEVRVYGFRIINNQSFILSNIYFEIQNQVSHTIVLKKPLEFAMFVTNLWLISYLNILPMFMIVHTTRGCEVWNVWKLLQVSLRFKLSSETIFNSQLLTRYATWYG